MKNTSLFPLFALVLVLSASSTEAQNGASAPMIYTVAGGTFGNGKLATTTGIGEVHGVVTDNNGNIYFADYSNFLIRKVDPNGILTTVAGNGIPSGVSLDISVLDIDDEKLPTSSSTNGDGGKATSASLGRPQSLCIDKGGNLYFWDGYARIRKVDTNGIITTVAGNGIEGFSGDGGAATGAKIGFSYTNLVFDSGNNLYFLDESYRIRKVDIKGVISTIAGNGTLGFTGDGGPATSAEIAPGYLSLDTSGSIYFINDLYNYSTNQFDIRIRKVGTNGIINTVAGNGIAGFSGDGGPATAAEIDPTGLALDSGGDLYFSDSYCHIRKVGTNGIINVIAGNGTCGFSGDGGPATAAEINPDGSLLLDNSNNLYFGQDSGSRIREVGTNGIINTIAGNGTDGFSGDGGLATAAEIDGDITALDNGGNLYLFNYDPDLYGERIRRVDSNDVITTVAGNGSLGFSGDGGAASATEIDGPGGLAVDGSGNLYIADFDNYRIRKVGTSGTISTAAGNGEGCFYYNSSPCLVPGPATDAKINQPAGVAIDSGGNFYFTSGCAISKVDVGGVLSTIAGDADYSKCGYSGDGEPATSASLSQTVAALAIDLTGDLYIGDTNNFRVRKVDSKGVITTVAGNGTEGYSGDGELATNAEIGHPAGVAVDTAGNLYIADGDNFRVRKVDTKGIITTYAGTGTTGFSGDMGPATSAQISDVTGLAVDKAGNLYIGDFFNNRIRKVDPSGIITTVTGNGTYGYSGDGGPASDAVITVPGGLAVDKTGALYFGDVFNYRVRKIVVAAPVPAISTISPNYGAPAAFINIAGTNFSATQGNGSVIVGDAFAQVTAWSNTAITVRVPSGADTGNLTVTAGGKTSNGAAFQFYPEPSISGLLPGSGPVGTPVTISGSNLLDGEGNGKVTFNGTPATIRSQTESSIQVNVPPGATTGPVTAHINGVTVKSPKFTVTVPQISGITPNYGAPAAFINITGTNFGATQGNSYVIVGDAFAQVAAWSDTAITIRVPSRAITGNLVVGVGGKSSNGASFTFYGEPSITSLLPGSGPVGTLVTINGNNLLDGGNNAIVTFNGVPAPVSTDTNSQIQVTVPTGATSGRVLVKVNGVTVIAPTNFSVTAPG